MGKYQDWSRAMVDAAGEGRQEIVDQMLELGEGTLSVSEYNYAMKSAAEGGHQKIVNQIDFMKRWGAI